jgi:peptide/nickel transport system substrate-binding protein
MLRKHLQRNKTSFGFTGWVAVSLSAIFLSGCSPQNPPQSLIETDSQGGLSSKVGGTLILSTTADPKSFNPILAKETSTTSVTHLIFEGLTRTNGVTTLVEPNLARSWEHSEDGRTWTFHLEEDVLWSDGTPFTADDVVFTFQKLIYNPDIPSSSRDIFTIDGKEIQVSKTSPHTVRFELPVPFAPFLRSLSQEILPRHRLIDVVERGEFNHHWGLDSPPSEIIGTGPFLLKSHRTGERIDLVRNPRYWKHDLEGNRLPYLAHFVYLVVTNQDVALLKFREGTLDSMSLRGSDFAILKPLEESGKFTVYNTGPAFGTNFLFFNQNTGTHPETGEPYVEPYKTAWFRDARFRRAVSYAIDRESMINIVMSGLGFPQHAAMSPSAGIFYNAGVTRYRYDPERAKALLEEAGLIDRDRDGVREDAQGNVLEFTLYTNSGNTDRLKIAEIIRKDLEMIGCQVHFTALEFNHLVTKLDASLDWEAMILGLTGGIDPHFGSNVWYSWGQLHMWFPRQSEPSTPWEARIDEIYTEAAQELNEERRKALYDEWQQIVADQVPFIYTVLPASVHVVRNRFGNLNPTSYGGVFHNLEEIYIKKP